MQTQTEIRTLLEDAGLAPQRKFGQNFLIERGIMDRLLALADVQPGRRVLEVGPGTGSLTEELLARGADVVAVEVDRGLFGLLQDRFAGQERVKFLHADALATKHAIAPAVLDAMGPEADLVSNLPFQIATPLLAECLLCSWRSAAGQGGPRFDRLTFTVQREVADRLAAPPGCRDYGPVSVLVALLGTVTLGPIIPPNAFWPKPQVYSRILRVDFDPAAAGEVASDHKLTDVLSLAFNHRRKQISWNLHGRHTAVDTAAFANALDAAAIDHSARPDTITPEQYRTLANAM